jgi:uncharacterized protein (DUF1800 family)
MFNLSTTTKKQITAFLLMFSVFLGTFVNNTQADTKTKLKPLTEDQKILHVLNRLGFGARPGDVEKVKAIGLEKYIEQQLNPGSIDDSTTEAKLSNLEVFKMSTADIFAKYPNPAAFLRMFQNQNQNNQTANNDQMPMTEQEQAKRRQQLQEIYQKYNLRPANQIVGQVAANRILRAVYSEKQLQEVMVDFWQNHFNVFAGKNIVRWYIPSYERDVLRKYALGNFKDLLVATAQHPAMLVYLDNFESISPEANQRQGNGPLQRVMRNDGQLTPQMRERIKQQRGLTDAQLDELLKQRQNQQQQQRTRRGINENYARELMELHTLGVDGGYTQKDIIEVARAFTGWTVADPRGFRRLAFSMLNDNDEQRYDRLQRRNNIPEDVESGEFYFNANWHDKNEKTVLGQKINDGGLKDGLKVIDILVKHPSTAKFIAKKLAVKFVNDNPSPDLVNRVAETFQKTNGDIRATLKTLFASPEFFAPENYRAKIKTPFEVLISSIRTLGGNTNSSPALMAMLAKMGEPLYGYQAPTGYPDTAEDWVNTGALLERLNFAIALAANRIPGTNIDLAKFTAGSNLTEKEKLLNQFLGVILHNEVSEGTKKILLQQLNQPLPEPKLTVEKTDDMTSTVQVGNGRRNPQQVRLLDPRGNPEVFKVVGLILGSPEFQRQ